MYQHFMAAERDLQRDMSQFPRTATQAVPTAVMEVQSGGSGYESTVRLGQYPGQPLKLGQSDQREGVQV